MTETKSIVGVFCLHVNATDRGFEDADLGALVAGFDHAGFFFDAHDLTDNAADGGDLVANRQIISHGVVFLLLLLLGTNAKEIENGKHHNEHQDHHQRSTGASSVAARSGVQCNNQIHVIASISYFSLIVINFGQIYEREFVNIFLKSSFFENGFDFSRKR